MYTYKHYYYNVHICIYSYIYIYIYYVCVCVYIYIYIYINKCMRPRRRPWTPTSWSPARTRSTRCSSGTTHISYMSGMANPPTNIVGFESSIIFIIRGAILMSIGDFLESLSQAMLVGIMLVGRLCVFP